MNNPWQLCDDLIGLIPSGTKVRNARIGNWACVTPDVGTGATTIYRGGPRSGFAERNMVGHDLRDATSAVKPWDLELAALRVAIINSLLTTEERVSTHLVSGEDERPTLKHHVRTHPDLRIATIGHFGGIRKYARGRDLIVLGQSPSGNDLPDPAVKYLLVSREPVSITGSVLTNKTLPRLFELYSEAGMILVSSSVPFAPEMLPTRVAKIGRSLMIGPDHIQRTIGLGGGTVEARQGPRIFNHTIRRNP